MNNCSTVGAVWRAAVIEMWHKPSSAYSGAQAVVQLELPRQPAVAGYGAPKKLFLIVKELPKADGMLDLEIVWGDKRATRLYEGAYFEVLPALEPKLEGSGIRPQDRAEDSSGSLSQWKLLIDKVGSEIDAADVVTHGGSA